MDLKETFSPILFLSYFKEAFVRSIFKFGNKSEVTNYLINTLLFNIAKHVFGFRLNVGTKNSSLLVTSKIHDILNNRIPILWIFQDLKKTFDTLSHSKETRTRLFSWICFGPGQQPISWRKIRWKNKNQWISNNKMWCFQEIVFVQYYYSFTLTTYEIF